MANFRVIEPDDEIHYVRFVGGPLDGRSLECRAGDVPPTLTVDTKAKHVVNMVGDEAGANELRLSSESAAHYVYSASEKTYHDRDVIQTQEQMRAQIRAEMRAEIIQSQQPTPRVHPTEQQQQNRAVAAEVDESVRVVKGGTDGGPIVLEDGNELVEIYKPSQTDLQAIVKKVEVPGVAPDMTFADAMKNK